MGFQLRLKVWGDRALFNRPEFKAERVSYDVPTPTAALGILDSIFWKPEISRKLQRIEVLKPIDMFGFMVNNVKSKASRTGQPIAIEDDRTQRHCLILRDVAYIFQFEIELASGVTESPQNSLNKYKAQYERRISKGQCFQQPYFGVREFVASFGFPDGNEQPIDYSADLGWMLRDIDYKTGTPSFYRPQIERGIIHVT